MHLPKTYIIKSARCAEIPSTVPEHCSQSAFLLNLSGAVQAKACPVTVLAT